MDGPWQFRLCGTALSKSIDCEDIELEVSERLKNVRFFRPAHDLAIARRSCQRVRIRTASGVELPL